MIIQVAVISGFMVGIEVIWGEGVVVLDLGIIRLFISKGETNNE